MNCGTQRLHVRWLLYGVLVHCLFLSPVISWLRIRIQFSKGGLTKDQCDDLYRAVIKREEWGALPPRQKFPMNNVAKDVVVWQTGPDICTIIGLSPSNCEPCLQDSDCIKRGILALQQDDLENNLDDIRYHFIIDEQGVIYEGRGWTVAGQEKNRASLDVALVGDFTKTEPTQAAQDALNCLLLCGKRSDNLLYNSELIVSPAKAGRAFFSMVARCQGLCV